MADSSFKEKLYISEEQMRLVIVACCFLLALAAGWTTPGRPARSDMARANQDLARTTASVSALVAVTLLPGSIARAEDVTTPEITTRVKLDIKIANYTEESIGTNKGAAGSGSVILGLYGKDAPQSVNLFLNTVRGDGVTTPSFFNAQF